ncbi:ferredoxin [Streptomyces rubradiris]|uniref:Ferredoxin n=1 Tax=Streptomyces rubradiris TaxID=285531 RepID=A0ABQ3RR79_STRRR|nr:ferredoxin [Streptomyces rubradiris]GHH24571.1 ferredoxin [Streptomyces rubradiris]GHI58292.1 ferredoxin [Streptomyces rubradiris]
MQIQADTERCVGAGMCALTAPDLFDQSDHDGTVVLLTDGRCGRQTADAARAAVANCPSGALTLTD